MCTKGIHGRVSINTLDQYPRSILNWHPDCYLVNTLLTLDQQLFFFYAFPVLQTLLTIHEKKTYLLQFFALRNLQYAIITYYGITYLHIMLQLVDIWRSVDQLIWIDWKLVDSQPTVDQDVDGVSIEYWSRILIEGIDWHLTADVFRTHDPLTLGMQCAWNTKEVGSSDKISSPWIHDAFTIILNVRCIFIHLLGSKTSWR